MSNRAHFLLTKTTAKKLSAPGSLAAGSAPGGHFCRTEADPSGRRESASVESDAGSMTRRQRFQRRSSSGTATRYAETHAQCALSELCALCVQQAARLAPLAPLACSRALQRCSSRLASPEQRVCRLQSHLICVVSATGLLSRVGAACNDRSRATD